VVGGEDCLDVWFFCDIYVYCDRNVLETSTDTDTSTDTVYLYSVSRTQNHQIKVIRVKILLHVYSSICSPLFSSSSSSPSSARLAAFSASSRSSLGTSSWRPLVGPSTELIHDISSSNSLSLLSSCAT